MLQGITMNKRRMIMKTSILLAIMLLVSIPSYSRQENNLKDSREVHLRNIRQLTFGGTNAEAYFSFDETKLIFQSTRSPYECDQIFIMNLDGSDQHLVSTGRGRTTCAYFYPDGKKILYASTHLSGDQCPPSPDKSKGYVWGVFNAYDIFQANVDGSDLKLLSQSKGYDAEATISPTRDKIVFTSSRDGDLELYRMRLDGSDVRRLTHDVGYDGGPNFSWNGKRIVYRGYHPKDSTEVREYETLLGEQLVRPTKMEIFICDEFGGNRKQLTRTNAANFAPIFLPDDKRIIFSSNMRDSSAIKRHFHLFLMDDDGNRLEEVTFDGSFDAFPMFTHDGKKLVFVSDRNAKSRYEFNVFIADWVE
jgi:TolB protein